MLARSSKEISSDCSSSPTLGDKPVGVLGLIRQAVEITEIIRLVVDDEMITIPRAPVILGKRRRAA